MIILKNGRGNDKSPDIYIPKVDDSRLKEPDYEKICSERKKYSKSERLEQMEKYYNNAKSEEAKEIARKEINFLHKL